MLEIFAYCTVAVVHCIVHGLFRMGADRHNGILMPLLLLVAETKIVTIYKKFYFLSLEILKARKRSWH